MRLLICFLAATLFFGGCANKIRESDAVIWDRIEGTENLQVEQFDLRGGTAHLNLKYTCERKQFAVTNVYETKWRGVDELYEVPVGIITIVPSFLWFVGSNVVTLGAIEPATARAPVYWSFAGLNPCLPVENGMFTERYSIREKGGSRREQDNSKAEPYEASVGAYRGRVKVRFEDPSGERGDWVDLDVGEELLVKVNLVEASPAIPNSEADRVEMRVKVRPSSEMSVDEKDVEFFIDMETARKLFEARGIVDSLDDLGEVEIAEVRMRLNALGFGAEAAQLIRAQ